LNLELQSTSDRLPLAEICSPDSNFDLIFLENIEKLCEILILHYASIFFAKAEYIINIEKLIIGIFFYRIDGDSEEETVASKTHSDAKSKGESSTADNDEYNFKTYDNECRRKNFKYWEYNKHAFIWFSIFILF